MKISVIGAGSVGGLTAMRIVENNLADVFLIDVNENIARAKASDIDDARSLACHDKKIIVTNDFSLISDSKIVVITAGFARQPGMTREDLLKKNYAVLKDVSNNIKVHCPNAIIVVVTNPVDIMTYVVIKETGFKKKKVLGMGSSLDSSRFNHLISHKLNVSILKVKGLVIGAHGENMLPLPRFTKVNNHPLEEVLKSEEIIELVEMTKNRGAEILALYGAGSAYFAPSRAIFDICDAIIHDRDAQIPVSVYLNGEYGISDVCIGVLAKINKTGVHQIIDLKLKEKEQQIFLEAANSLKGNIRLLYPFD